MTFCKCFEPGRLRGSRLDALSYDGLVTYRRTGGSTFGQLVGDLATGVPEPSADGRTYVFRLRPNLRYSDGTPVRPEDFRAALERRPAPLGNEVPPYYNRIRGAPACVATPKRCDLSKGIETDPVARTITIRLTAPDPDLVHVLALPFAWLVPADHPFHGTDIPPGTGPYKIAELDVLHGARLVRNPHFRVWSQDARPDGYADQIVVHLGDGVDDVHRQVRKVQRGESDATLVVGQFGARSRALACARSRPSPRGSCRPTPPPSSTTCT